MAGVTAQPYCFASKSVNKLEGENFNLFSCVSYGGVPGFCLRARLYKGLMLIRESNWLLDSLLWIEHFDNCGRKIN